MKRVLLVVVLGLLALAALVEAQSTGINDREVQRFVLPGTNTTGARVHASSAHMSLTLPKGNIIAAGGYKVAFAYAHGNNVLVSISNNAMPIAGTAPVPAPANPSATGGVSYQRAPYEGSIIAVSIGASAALTAGSATAEATIRRSDGTISATSLTAVANPDRQFATNTQGRGISTFTASDGIGCRLTTTSDVAPLTAEVACTVIIEF